MERERNKTKFFMCGHLSKLSKLKYKRESLDYSIFYMFDIFQMKKVIKKTHAFQSCPNSSNKLAFWAWAGL